MIWPIKVTKFPILQRATYTGICLAISSMTTSLIFLLLPQNIYSVSIIGIPLMLGAFWGISYFNKGLANLDKHSGSFGMME